MAYVNVIEWSPEHVAEWLRGLEYSLIPYVQFFLNNGIDGCHLLNLTANDLEDLHIFKIGHQQLILEAVELLRQLHYSLNSETLQSLAVKLSCKARSLHNDLKLNGPSDDSENNQQERVSTNVLSSVSEVLTSVKALVSWLDRSPFQKDPVCIKLKKNILKLSIELASTTQRDQFAERPHILIKKNSAHIAELCDQFVQNSMDSLILQPASLDFAVIKKKPDEELGIHIKSTYSGVHIIGGIKDQSPTKSCNKVEKGDEIVQVNYQTVIGWQQKKLVTTMTENSTELQLTLKKRPRHVNLLGEVIILRPYRIPSKKTIKKKYNWLDENQLSAIETNPNDIECERSDSQDDDSAFLPSSSNQLLLTKELPVQYRVMDGNSATTIQRRATVSGASPILLKSPVSIDDLVNDILNSKLTNHYGRSISHDSSCKKYISESKTLPNHEEVPVCREDTVKSIFEDCTNTLPLKNDIFPNKSDKVVKINENKLLCDDALSVQGVVITEAENAVKNNCTNLKKYLIENSSSKISECQTDDENILDKPYSTLCDWENNVTEFFGRRPRAYDLSNEIAGIKEKDINPVYLRKASKLESSPSNQDGENTFNQEDEVMSYQVVIVGGVPQKCINAYKEEKEKKKCLEHRLNPYEIKQRISNQFRNRLISCNDLGHGDCEGWLFKQKKKKGFLPSSHIWAKRWIILKDCFLYCYKDKSDMKAECLIWLPGSTASPIKDYSPKKFTFRIRQQQSNFYFATESQKDFSNWMNKIGLAVIGYDDERDSVNLISSDKDSQISFSNNFYSETDDSENGSPVMTRHESHGYNATTDIKSCELTPKEDQWNKSLNPCANKNILFSSDNPDFKRVQAFSHVFESQNFENQHKTTVSNKRPSLSHPHLKIKHDNLSVNPMNNANVSFSKFYPAVRLNEPSQCPETELEQKKSFDETFHEDTYCQITYNINSSDFNSVDEEYDATTSSLGRSQRPLVKEISPGLVARMAVSYTNLSKSHRPNSKLSKNGEIFNAIPSPGYVAKMSDSFDHLALNKTNNNNSLIKKHHDESFVGQKELHQYDSYKCKRSSSESQVTKSFSNTKQYSSPLGIKAPNSQVFFPDNKKSSSQSEKYVSLLDREYNRVFDGKKISQHHLKSSTNQNKLFYSIKNETQNSFTECQAKYSTFSGNQNMIRDPISKDVISSNIMNDEISVTSTSHSLNNITNKLCLQHSDFSEQNKISSCKGVKHIGIPFQESVNKEDYDIRFLTVPKSNDTALCYGNSNNCELGIGPSSEITSSDTDSPKMSFKFFSSPKFMKKLTSPKLDKKNIFKSKKLAKEQKKSTQKETKAHPSEKKFFGSPILARTFFGSPKTEKKVMTVSSGVQTDIALMASLNPKIGDSIKDQNFNQSSMDLKPSEITLSSAEGCDEVTLSKSSSCNSLASYTSSIQSPFINSVYYVEAKIKPQITVSLPFVPDDTSENRLTPLETSRTPLKPMMGVTMLAKKRLPSISGESTASVSSSKISQESCKETNQILSEYSMEINGDEDEEGCQLKKYYEENSSLSGSVPNFDETDNSNASS